MMDGVHQFLFVMRLLSGAVLLGILVVLFLSVWSDYRSVIAKNEVQRRVYGRLIAVNERDGVEIAYPLLPLTSIGRAPTNTIPVDDDFASSEHAILALRNGQWWLEDRKSRNGTLINGIPISAPIIITEGDVIGIGSHAFRVHLE